MILIVILILTLIFLENKSVYTGKEEKICGQINDVLVDDNKATIEIKAKEKIIGYYYFKNLDNQQFFTDNYHLGDQICVQGVLERPNDNRIFNLFNYRKYLLSKNIYYLINISSLKKIANNSNFIYTIKNKIVNRILTIKYSQSYLFAFVLGDSRYLNDEVMSAYRSVGVSHLFAVSGMHISFLASFILFFLDYLIKERKVKLIVAMIFILLIASFFVLSPSLIRAVSLFFCMTLDKLFHLKQKPVKYLIIILLINLIVNRYSIYNIGFIFSYVISLSLLLAQTQFKNIKNKLKLSFAIALISFLVSMPILINNFFEINIMTPFINLLVIPYVSFILFPGAFFCLCFPSLDYIYHLFVKVLEFIVGGINELTIFKLSLAKPSLVVTFLYYGLIILIIYMFFKKKYGYFLILILVIMIHHNIRLFDFSNNLYMIDVGQGDCLLLTLSSHKSVLIDTGGNIYNNDSSLAIDKLIPFFKSIGLKKIDYMILTHGDYDHVGEAVSLIKNFSIKNVYLNSGNNNDIERQIISVLKRENINYHQISKGNLTINNVTINFLNMCNTSNENEDSLIAYTKINDIHILFMGDASQKVEKRIIDEYNLPTMDILKVGHHGSRSSTNYDFIRTIKPKKALISAGKNNLYHHPHKETINTLENFNSQILVTSMKGSVKISLDNKLAIHTCL